MGFPHAGAVTDRLRRITKEVSTLPGQLPLEWESSILVAMDADRMDMLRWVAAWGMCSLLLCSLLLCAWSGRAASWWPWTRSAWTCCGGCMEDVLMAVVLMEW